MHNGIDVYTSAMSLNSQRYLQFHPMVMLVAMLILVLLLFAKTSFLFLFISESVNILVRPHAGFPLADIFVVHTGTYVRDVFLAQL